METKKNKIDILWILDTFDFFLFMIFSVLMWCLFYSYLFFLGINPPYNSNIDKPQENKSISEYEKPKQIKLKFIVDENSN